MKTLGTIFASILVVAAVASVATAANVYQIDFSDGDGSYSGTNAPAATGDSNWLVASDPSADAASLGGLTVDLGRAPDDTAGSVSFKDNRDPNEVNAAGSGIFGTALTQDAMTSLIAGQYPRGPIGVAINGLPAGTYDVYVVAHYAANAGDELVCGIGTRGGMPSTGGDSVVFQKGTYPETTLTASNTSSWELGNNYAKMTITIDASNPVLGVYVGSLNTTGDAFDADNATISAIQIVPEPATLALVALGGFAMIRRRR